MKIHEYNEMMAYLTRPARTGYGAGTLVKLPEYYSAATKAAKTFVPLIKKGATDILIDPIHNTLPLDQLLF